MLSPVALIDNSMFIKVLDFWRSKNLMDENVYQLLGIDQECNLPERLSAAPVADAHYYIQGKANNPLLSFELGHFIGNSELDILQLLATSASLNEGVAAIMPFLYLTSAAIKFELHVTPTSTIATVESIDDVIFNRPECGFSEQALGVAATFFHNYLINSDRAAFAASDLTMMIPDCYSEYASELSDLYQIQVITADRFGLEIRKEAWVARSQVADGDRFDYLLRQLRKADKQLKKHLIVYGELTQALGECLKERHFSQELVAERLSINVRNLQRRLKSLGTSYQDLIDEVRHDHAITLVIDSDIALTEIAYRIGYAEPSAFYKAFRRWTGYTPGDYRYLNSVDGLDRASTVVDDLLRKEKAR